MSAATETGQSTFDLASDTEVVMTRVIGAPVELVFDAHTQPEHLKKWTARAGRLEHERL